MATLGERSGLEFECSLRLDDRRYEEFSRVSEKALGHDTVVVLTTNIDVTSVFGDFAESDWQSVLDNWNAKRATQTEGLLGFLRDLQAGDNDVLALGNLNAYGEKDPVLALAAGGQANWLARGQ